MKTEEIQIAVWHYTTPGRSDHVINVTYVPPQNDGIIRLGYHHAGQFYARVTTPVARTCMSNNISSLAEEVKKYLDSLDELHWRPMLAVLHGEVELRNKTVNHDKCVYFSVRYVSFETAKTSSGTLYRFKRYNEWLPPTYDPPWDEEDYYGHGAVLVADTHENRSALDCLISTMQRMPGVIDEWLGNSSEPRETLPLQLVEPLKIVR